MSRKVPEWSTNVCGDEEMQNKCESCSVTEMEQKLRLCAFLALVEGEYFTDINISEGPTAEPDRIESNRIQVFYLLIPDMEIALLRQQDVRREREREKKCNLKGLNRQSS